MSLTKLKRYRNIAGNFEAFMAASSAPLPRTVWFNHQACHRDTFLRWIGGCLVELPWYKGAFHITELNRESYYRSYLSGLFHIQEEVSLIPVRLLNLKPGDSVLDLCAAPGNKTAQAATVVGPSGYVIANDISRSRAGIIQLTLDRLSLANVAVTKSDAAAFPYSGHLFDAVIADVPCTCEGTSRKNPGALASTTAAFRKNLIARQKNILQRALELCRPGGHIVYSTCTYAPEENEGVVSEVLERTEIGRETEIAQINMPGLISVPGLGEWNGESYHRDINRTLRIWPHLQDTGGFYAALLKRKGPRDTQGHTDQPGHDEGVRATKKAIYPPPGLMPSDAAWFGLHESLCGDYTSWHLSNKSNSLVNSSLQMCAAPQMVAVGVRAVNTKGSSPRVSTAGARLLGPLASKQIIDLATSQVVPYLCGESVELASTSAAKTEAAKTGRVIVRSEGVYLGLGTLNNLGNSPILESLFPRTFAGIQITGVFARSKPIPT